MRAFLILSLLAAPVLANPGARKPPPPIQKTVLYDMPKNGVGRIRHTKWRRYDGTTVHQVDGLGAKDARLWTRRTETRDDGSKRISSHTFRGQKAGERADSVIWNEGATKLYVGIRRGSSSGKVAGVRNASTGLRVQGHVLEGNAAVSVVERGTSTLTEVAAATARVRTFLAAKWLPRGLVKP